MGGGVFKNSISPNSSLKFIIITNFTHFYFFKANEFERLFYKNKEFADLYANFTSANSLFKGNTKEFYKETQKILATLNDNIKGFHLDLSQLKTDKFDFKIGQIPFKVFHKDFLLDEFNPNDANSLNEHFYKELLCILGLQEKKDDSRLLIVPSAEPKNAQNTLYNAIITKLPKDKQDLESTMNFIVLWLNRILFLKLIEANLVRFNDDANLKFLNLSKVPNFKALSQLFFDILAKKPQNRTQANSALAYLPYLNSSLFVRQKCENLLDISDLDDSATLSYYAHTQIKDKNAKESLFDEESIEVKISPSTKKALAKIRHYEPLSADKKALIEEVVKKGILQALIKDIDKAKSPDDYEKIYEKCKTLHQDDSTEKSPSKQVKIELSITAFQKE